MSELTANCPLVTYPTKTGKPFSLNLNIYRNAHWNQLHKAKLAYTKQFLGLNPHVLDWKIDNPCAISYTLYPKTQRECDISNVLCVVDKFVCDILVEYGILKDDNFKHLPTVTYQFGAIDTDNPRATLRIDEL